MKRSLFIVIGLSLFLFPGTVKAKVSMAALEHVGYVNTDQLYTMYKKNADFVLINTLSPIEFAEQRIKGSINVPYSCLKKGRAKLPADKAAKLVFYCKGPK